jgi:DNA-binding IclR family transcriptional regulator
MSTANRLLGILDLFTLDRPDLSVDEAAAELNMPTSTVYRYFNNLTKSGLVATVGNARYILGPAIIRYDRQLRLTDPLVRSARTEMEGLAKAVAGRGVVFLCRLFRDQVMCVSQASSGQIPFTIGYDRGRLMPLFAGSASRVILAHLPLAKVQSLFRRNPEDFRSRGMGEDWPQVRETLKQVRAQGGYTTVGEIDPGMRGMSVPVLMNAKIVGSLNIAGPRQGFTPAQISRALEDLTSTTRRIVDELHHWESTSA